MTLRERFNFFLSHPFSQWIYWFPQIWKIQIIQLEGESGWHFLLPDFFCCHVGYACLRWNGECCELYQWWHYCYGFVSNTVMRMHLKLASFYCFVRQKVIFKSVPCVSYMCSAFSAVPSIWHLHPALRTGSPTVANGNHTLKIMNTCFSAFQSNFFTDVYV